MKREVGSLLAVIRVEIFNFIISREFAAELSHETEKVKFQIKMEKKRHLRIVD